MTIVEYFKINNILANLLKKILFSVANVATELFTFQATELLSCSSVVDDTPISCMTQYLQLP